MWSLWKKQNGWTKADTVIFFAGFEVFHTLSHILLAFAPLPITMFSITVTPALNLFAIIFNAVITIALFMWIACLKK